MAFKVTIVCLVAVLIQTIKAQCIGNPSLAGPGLALGNNYLANQGLGYGINPGALSNGGGLIVTSSSPIAPTGISVLAENLLIEGPVAVAGQLPLLGTIALEGAVPAGGQAGASYGCGNGNVGILNEIGAGGIGAGGIGSAGIGAAGLGGAGIGAAGLGAAGIGAAGIGAAGLVPGLGLGAGLGGCGRLL